MASQKTHYTVYTTTGDSIQIEQSFGFGALSVTTSSEELVSGIFGPRRVSKSAKALLTLDEAKALHVSLAKQIEFAEMRGK